MNHRKYEKPVVFNFLYRYHILNWSATLMSINILMENQYSYFNHFLPITNKLRLLYKLSYLMINTTHDKKQKETLKNQI